MSWFKSTITISQNLEFTWKKIFKNLKLVQVVNVREISKPIGHMHKSQVGNLIVITRDYYVGKRRKPVIKITPFLKKRPRWSSCGHSSLIITNVQIPMPIFSHPRPHPQYKTGPGFWGWLAPASHSPATHN